MQYYVRMNGQPVGPMSAHQVIAYNPNQNTMVSTDGYNWQPLYTYPELMQLLSNRGYNPGGYEYGHGHGHGYSQSEVQSKKTLCGIMALLFGTLGIQYFVIGKVAGGFITILLTIVTCGLWSILVLVQGILILCMSDAEFKRKYLDSTSVLPLF